MRASIRSETDLGSASDAEAGAIERRLDLRAEASKALDRLKRSAARPACIVLLGEGNAGKTTLANKLIGNGLLPTSVIANTRYPMLLRHAAQAGVTAVTASCERVRLEGDGAAWPASIVMLEIGLPDERLAGFEVLDTPAHVAIGSVWELPGLSPLLLPVWCTTASQAWKESERRAWMEIDRRRRRHGVLAVTRLDRIGDTQLRDRLMQRLRDEAGPHFGAILPEGDAAPATLAESVAGRCRPLMERRRRTVERLSARIVDLTNRAMTPEGASRLAVIGLRKAKAP